MPGQHKNIQSVLFPRAKFSVAQARHWLGQRGFKSTKVHTTDIYHRFRQQAPDPNRHYILITLENGVKIITFR